MLPTPVEGWKETKVSFEISTKNNCLSGKIKIKTQNINRRIHLTNNKNKNQILWEQTKQQ